MGRQHIRSNTQVLFGKRLKALRHAANVTQEQIEEATNVDQSYIAKIEGGENSIGINYVSVLADFFGLEDYEMFLYRDPVPDGKELEKNVIRFLKKNGINPTTFFKKGLSHYLVREIFPSRFLNTPRFSKEISIYLKENYNVDFSTSSIAQALDGFCKKGVIEKIKSEKKSKFLYKKK